jgi:type IV pilus assembly protein PilY1
LDVSNAVVYENTGYLTGVTATASAGSECAAGAVASFDHLECFLRQYAHAADAKDGWQRTFPTAGERNVSQAALLAGALTYTSYLPSSAACEAEGTSDLFALYFGTGTAYPEPIIGLNNSIAAHNGNAAINTTLDLGAGLALSPSLHSGSGYEGGAGRSIKAFVQTSTGTTKSIDEVMPFTVRPGEISWRGDAEQCSN